MTYPAALMCHSANLQTSTTLGTENAWGVKPGTPVYTAIKCRFGKSRKSYNYQDSGDRKIENPVCIISADTIAEEGNVIVGLSAPFDETYHITEVNPAMLASTVSHYVLSLKAVE